ncbi:MAG: hypothetical protein JSV05_07555 [Candidatus Bathyarchaeota archaeon]|nr:MAG: hypothetical protein JSV05_07555 [Candidatus Bathyarchaeota archaeon]
MGFFKRFTKPKASVSLTLSEKTIELGNDLDGSVDVSCEEEFDATEVRAELRCIEKRRRERWIYDKKRGRKIRQVYWDIATLHSDNPRLGDKLHLVPNFRKTYPLSINIPVGGRESFDGLDASIKWLIKGVVAIKGRPDVTSETTELQVVKASAGSAPREKKVKMVSCEYCEGLMPQTDTSCPNCGAPRKELKQRI